VLNHCQLEFDASCGNGDTFDWSIDMTKRVGGPFMKSGQVVTHDFGICSGEKILVKLKVVGEGGKGYATLDKKIYLPSASNTQAFEHRRLQTSFAGFLVTGTQRADGYVDLNGSRREVIDSEGSYQHNLQGIVGDNTVEAFIASKVEGEAYWKFDFSGTGHFVPGSLAVEQGHLMHIDGYSIGFHLTGSHTNHIKFKFQLSP